MDTVRLVKALESFDLDAREIAEAVWLSRNWDAPATRPAAEPEPAETPPPPASPAPDDDEVPDDPMPLPDGPDAPGEQPIRVAARRPSPASTGATLVQVPEPSAFPSAAALHRALRPLKRRHPAPHAVVVDEKASAERIAETGTLSLVLRRAQERWFDVALVVDTAVSMTVWEPAVRDLHRALRQFGGFRDVRRWDLVACGIVATGSADVRRPGELVDPAGRRIVLMVTDATAGMWREPAATEMLERWARSGPLLMVQPLPERLWHRTALPARRGSFHSLAPGEPTARLRFVERRRVPRAAPPGSVVVPVAEMSADWLAAWTSLVMSGPARVALPGTRLGVGAPAPLPDQGPEELSPEALVEQFRATASPAAFRLATYLSATSADLDVMRLVQRTFLPRSGPTELAEVLLSGLLVRNPDEALEFRFADGVRDLLHDDLRVPESRDVLRVVGGYIASRAGGSGRTFPAVVDGPGDGRTVTASSEIFAWVPAEVAGRLSAPAAARRSALVFALAGAGAQAVASALRTHYGFDHIRLHTEDPPTRASIVAAYEELIAGAGPGDAVVVYLHGPAFGETVTLTELDAFHRRLTAVTDNVTVIYDVSSLTQQRPDPRCIEVYADSDGEHLFGQELARALTEATGLQISWATLIEQVRRRILRLVPGRRPTVLGPARRVLFGTEEARNESTLPIVATGRDGLAQILGARLLNVQVGDEFAILAPESDESGSQPALGTAIVARLAESSAYARVELVDTATGIPAGAVAYRTRAVAERLGVRLPPLGEDLERLYGAVGSSSVLRPSDDDWVCEVRIDDRHRLTIHDRIGPLSDPVSALSGTGRVFADLERLARATALRRLAEDPAMTMEPVTVEFGRVVDGELLPLDGSPLLYADDRVYIALRNDGERPVHVSLVDIGVAAEVAVLTRSAPSGIRLDPGDRYVAGSTNVTPRPRGLMIAWPAGLAPIGPRPETILVITTAEPHDLGPLEQRGLRAALRGSPLEQMLAQATHGTSRSTGADPDDRSGAYAIRAITFDVSPRPRPVEIPENWPASASIMDAAELRRLCVGLRERVLHCDADLVARIASDVAEYSAYAQTVPGPTPPPPPPPLDELLRLMGWLLYEASWEAVQRVPVTSDASATADVDDISALADLARRLPWPEFAPRALGAVRAQALAASKQDTNVGYDVAWTVHQEARRRESAYRDSLSPSGPHERYLRDLDEVLLQLALAETGTACREAERVISRWPEDFPGEAEDYWLERVFSALSTGAEIGERAIDTARRIERRYGFVDSVTEDRLALHSALQNPGIMTARASALLLALGPAMQRMGFRPEDAPTWEQWEERELGRFVRAYRAIEAPVIVRGEPAPMRSMVMRQIIHMRLNLALLKPGYHLPSALSFDPVLETADLDDAALDALSARLAPRDGRPGSERGLGAVMMPALIRSIRACRGRGPADRGYDRWRVEWFRLDRLSGEVGRRARLDEALAASR